MDPQDLIAMALEIGFETERLRGMVDSLRASHDEVLEKEKERCMLRGNKQEILSKEAEKKKMVDDFMVFIKAAENNDLQIVRNFDEKGMMGAIATMMNSGGSGGGENGGFSGVYGDVNVLGIDLGLAHVATMDEIVALINGVGSFGGDNGGFDGVQGETNNAPENALNLGEDAMLTGATEGANSDGSDGGC